MSAAVAAAPHTALPLKRHVAAVVAGNALEFYDFLTYSFFAVYIGQAYFPSGNPASALLASLAAFGVGFATRPLGGILLGMLGDRRGRKPAMYLSFTLMGVGMLGVALTPGYATIGFAAPVLLIVFRLVQGFALGGEVGPTTAFLIEAPPPERRGFYGSLQSASQYVSTIASGTIGSVLAALMPQPVLAEWGWRIAFLIGAAIIPFGLMIRRSLPETMHVAQSDSTAPARAPWRDIVLSLMLMGGATIATYVILYLTTYAKAVLHLSDQWAFAATLGIGLGGTLGAPFGGLFSDRIAKRRPVMLWATAALLFTTVPGFIALNATHSGLLLAGFAFWLTFALGTQAGTGIMTICELMPPSIRSGAMSTIYAVAIAVFGGSAQALVNWLSGVFHNPLVPAWYMTAALCVSFLAALLLRETAPQRPPLR